MNKDTTRSKFVVVRLLGSETPRWLPTAFGTLDELRAWVAGSRYGVVEVKDGFLLHLTGTTATLLVTSRPPQ